MTLTVEIEQATATDIESIIDMLVNGYASEFGGSYVYDRDVGLKTLIDTLGRNQQNIFYAKDDKGKYIGGIGGTVYRHPWSGKIECSELFWYILPEHRRTGAGKALLDKLEQWARSMGAGNLVMTYIHGIGDDKMKAFYYREGFFPLEHRVIKVLNHGT